MKGDEEENPSLAPSPCLFAEGERERSWRGRPGKHQATLAASGVLLGLQPGPMQTGLRPQNLYPEPLWHPSRSHSPGEGCPAPTSTSCPSLQHALGQPTAVGEGAAKAWSSAPPCAEGRGTKQGPVRCWVLPAAAAGPLVWSPRPLWLEHGLGPTLETQKDFVSIQCPPQQAPQAAGAFLALQLSPHMGLQQLSTLGLAPPAFLFEDLCSQNASVSSAAAGGDGSTPQGFLMQTWPKATISEAESMCTELYKAVSELCASL